MKKIYKMIKEHYEKARIKIEGARKAAMKEFQLQRALMKVLIKLLLTKVAELTKQSGYTDILPDLKELGICYCVFAVTLFVLSGLLSFGAWDRLHYVRGGRNRIEYAQLSYELTLRCFSFITTDIVLPSIVIGLFIIYISTLSNRTKYLQHFFLFTQIMLILNLVLFLVTAMLFIPLLIFPDEFPMRLKNILDSVYWLFFTPSGDYLWDTLKFFDCLATWAKLIGAVLIIFSVVSAKMFTVKAPFGVWLIILTCLLEIISQLFKW